MQPENRHQAVRRSFVRFGVSIAAPVVAVFGLSGFCAPSAVAATSSQPVAVAQSAAVSTQWAESVRAHLGLSGGQPVNAGQVAPVHAVTAWTRSVEAHLADRAHRVAQAGRAALAWSESGMASWYGGRHAGRHTSSGDSFNPMQLTCAHPTLPLGTRVLVTSETTGRSVVVTVNDRGPFGGRIVDLSRAAAERIGMLGSGTASVTLEPASQEVVEVAQADESDTSQQAIAAVDAINQAPRGQRHTHHAGR